MNDAREHDEKSMHWLERPSTIRLLWRGFAVVLALIVLLQLFIDVHAYFGFDGLFGFNALLGFFGTLGMILFAKVLGNVLKRPDDYYDV